ncbi:MAG: hypothetical protein KatS3mg063_1065 [Tepidiforma sp.]|jgi:hypothetical protein|uniref:hypothetical protein n=1 Tax=Tepidiforma sp. TaxID=2682230 RepID=UPI0021DE6AF0|nr:hypothetical protein [Tepidiforma sp.]GIW15212.1 MAG: hypothetical protein KatS3mg063_1065 [Tepidiforma sp.]
MPDRGLRAIEGLAPSPFDAGPLEIAGRWVQVTFEVDRDAAMRWMPADVTRPVPCYGRLLAVDGESGGRPMRFAALALGGRFRMMPRNVLVEAVTADGAALPALAGPALAGDVRMDAESDGLAIAITTAEGVLAEARLPAPYAIEPAMLRWDGWVVYAPNNGGTALAEALVEVRATAARLSKGALFAPGPAADRSSPWRQLRSLLPISACAVEGVLRVGPAAVPAQVLMG